MFLRMSTLREGLPRTTGALTAVPGFKCGATLGAVLGSGVAGFILFAEGQDNGTRTAISVLISSIFILGSAGAGFGYGVGYGGANLFMKAFPATQTMRAPLVRPGIAPQFILFAATTFLPIAINLLRERISGATDSPIQNSPRL